MTPIVNGLAVEYSDEVDFQILDASSGIGQELFDFYGTFGHPSYVLIDPSGEVLWKGVGPQEAELLQDQFLAVIGP
jgi:hypothetical protein